MSTPNSPGLTLGREVLDVEHLDPNSPTFNQDVLAALQRLTSAIRAMGWPSAAVAGDDTSYQQVYTNIVADADVLYAGVPNDPTNPRVLVVSAAGSATTIYQEEGTNASTRGTANFIGDFVTVVDNAGSTRADITISITAGTYIDISGDTISVDLTEVSGYDGGENQYLKNEAGTIKWVTAATC